MDDAIRYLVVLLGEDEELYGLAVTVQYHVENVIAYDHIDHQAFISQSIVRGVYGEGFDQIKT